MRRSIMNECPEFESANGKLSVDFWVIAALETSDDLHIDYPVLFPLLHYRCRDGCRQASSPA